MCGIVAFVSGQPVQDRTVHALEKLEYRGYDSYGFSFAQSDGVKASDFAIVRGVGPLSEQAQALVAGGLPQVNAAIGHTRWATHGGVTVPNAHPHRSFDGKFAVVHNGVIENFLELKRDLIAGGVEFSSETDTEVIAHLLARHYATSGDLDAALHATLAQLSGEFGLAITCADRPELLIGVRRLSPIAVGIADGAGFICSDPVAVAGQDGWIAYLEEDQIAFVTRDAVRVASFLTPDFPAVELERIPLTTVAEVAELGHYPHFMIKEITETSEAVRTVAAMPGSVFAPAAERLATADIAFCGAGSSHYVCMLGQYFFHQIAGRRAMCHSADEFMNLASLGDNGALIAVSQSGETYDTLRVMEQAQADGAALVAVNNVAGSTAQRMSDFPILQRAGREVCVLSTKSVISQTAIVWRLAAEVAARAGGAEGADMADLNALAAQLDVLVQSLSPEIKAVAERYRWIEHWFFLGRGIHWPVAAESALKFKEVSYIHAEAMPAGFLKHGTISLIDEKFFTVAFIPNAAHDPESFAHVVSSLHEIRARGGNIIGFGHDLPSVFADGFFEAYVELPSVSKFMDPMIQLVAGELFAYHCAVKLGRNIDRPRALAKAVTVR
ncbi:glutamine--fructose-6-phosphate transaminase (isomerizing) [Sphingomonas sp. KR1UV-12]|uniref:Glutamine--fructose-6-phosphate aminotransferase [isomerizing] n=1 Tax=Sphingomonas aurea TaxID=3063994 RepID=A0ABT9EJI7_9SPHN|nr:glutamine--fructose-6-phosphate transaminase (isomerizing) [Sphingomonas sp. KR1UV-12]MDP1027104.1 glutamine--fructose-6-phosphate transaminase (isomerizing) [Sphingomonas sp. KR1UV-12]